MYVRIPRTAWRIGTWRETYACYYIKQSLEQHYFINSFSFTWSYRTTLRDNPCTHTNPTSCFGSFPPPPRWFVFLQSTLRFVYHSVSVPHLCFTLQHARTVNTWKVDGQISSDIKPMTRHYVRRGGVNQYRFSIVIYYPYPWIPTTHGSHLPMEPNYPWIPTTHESQLPMDPTYPWNPTTHGSQLPNDPTYPWIPPTHGSKLPMNPNYQWTLLCVLHCIWGEGPIVRPL